MEKTDWYYVYSQRYHPFHLYLQDKIPKNTFNAKGIFVDQSVFDEHLYKHSGEHFFSRITVKVEAVLHLIRIKRAAGDIWFQREHKNSITVNPGVMLIRPCEKTEYFWNRVLDDMKSEIDSMELQSINKILRETTIVWNLFHVSSASSSLTREAIPFGIYHILCGCDSRELDIGNKMCEATNCGQPMDKYIEQTRVELGRLYF